MLYQMLIVVILPLVAVIVFECLDNKMNEK